MLKKKKNELDQEEVIQKKREKTALEWMPIADIIEKTVYRKDNLLVGLLRVFPKNISLLSDREKKRIVASLAEGINGENQELEIFCVGRPVDLNNYLTDLQEKSKIEANFNKKRILKGFIQYASKTASSGETTERRFYIIVTQKNNSSKAEYDLFNRLEDLKGKLLMADLQASICVEDEIIDVYALFSSPIQSAYEKTYNEFNFPTVVY